MVGTYNVVVRAYDVNSDQQPHRILVILPTWVGDFVMATPLLRAIRTRFDPAIGVIVSDSLGRPFRLGTVGAAIGTAGLPAVADHRGRADLFGRPLEYTVTGFADEIAAAADLLAGQADEGRAVVHVRGLQFSVGDHSAHDLLRPENEDLYA